MAAGFIFSVVYILISHTAMVRADDTALSSLVAASNQLSHKLFPYLNKVQSWVYSPFSVHSAVSLTSLGAHGYTEMEMRKVLGIFQNYSLGSTHLRLVAEQRASSPNEQMVAANALYLHPQHQLMSDFVQSAAFFYSTKVANLDLKQAENTFNALVAEKTNRNIQNILPFISVNQNKGMTLINAVYFSGAWDQSFEELYSAALDFTKSDGVTVSLPTMQAVRIVRSKHDSTLQADVLQLQFNNSRFSLYLALPHAAEGLEDFEKTLKTSAENLESTFHGFKERLTYIRIPKFKIETTLDLVPALRGLGMRKALDCSGAADFSGISSGNICISHMVQKVLFEVTESGTTGSVFKHELPTPQVARAAEDFFYADRPFLFFLRDDVYELILFQGKFAG